MKQTMRQALPWLFVALVLAASQLPWRHWAGSYLPDWIIQAATQEERDAATIVRDASKWGDQRRADIVRVVDGDTFVARVTLSTGERLTTRVRLRDIDAPELGSASCAEEKRMAKASRDALAAKLAQGAIVLTHIGPDKYPGRIDAHVSAGTVPDVSQALVAEGHARRYQGGQRQTWCTD